MGKKEDFEKFLERQQKEAEQKKIDWESQKQDWLSHIDDFYRMVRGFLKSYTEQGRVEFSQKPMELSEEHIGHYTVDKLILVFGGIEVTFTPVGTLLIGAKGRIDMRAKAGLVRFVLVDKELSGPRVRVRVSINGEPPKAVRKKPPKPVEWAWRIAVPPPATEFVEINEETFFSALMEVMSRVLSVRV